MSSHIQIEGALFRHLLDNSVNPLVGSAIGGCLLALTHLNSAYQQQVAIWFSFLCVTVLVRTWLTKRCKFRFENRGYIRSDAIKYALTTSFSGLAWGLGGLFVLEASPMAVVVTITAIQGMIMGGALTLGAYLPSFYSFSLPAAAPLVAALVWRGGEGNILLATYTILFILLIIGISKKFNESLRKSWQLTIEKEHLLHELTKANNYQKSLANTDGLTGIANRRRFDDALAKELALISRTKSPLSLLILDVDHFKNFNDSYGHVAGDECLKKIAQILSQHFCRASDMPARYGGEEFAVIMPNTDEAGAIQQAKLIQSAVAKLNIQHTHSPTAEHITLSIGIVSLYTFSMRDAAELISIADKCLYQAKASGRNRVVSTSLQPSAQNDLVI